MAAAAPDDRIRRLREARATGRVPADLMPWLLEVAAAATAGERRSPSTPTERLALSLSEEVDRWMTRRRVTHRTISVSRRNLARCLKGTNVTLGTVADIADALGCDAVVKFRPRDIYGAISTTDGASDCKPRTRNATMARSDESPNHD
jgi:hypothetical protein